MFVNRIALLVYQITIPDMRSTALSTVLDIIDQEPENTAAIILAQNNI